LFKKSAQGRKKIILDSTLPPTTELNLFQITYKKGAKGAGREIQSDDEGEGGEKDKEEGRITQENTGTIAVASLVGEARIEGG
jgi:hypothetical protein